MWNPQLVRPKAADHARTADGVRLYAVGDVHGRADLLEAMLARIDEHRAVRPAIQVVEVFLGDYVDRGQQSRQVIDLLVARAARRPAIHLRGNHESCLLEFLENPPSLAEWRQCGGLTTLVSYGLTPSMKPDHDETARLAAGLAQALPDRHRDFLAGLQLSYQCGDYFFVHAGVRPGIPLADQREEDMLWIRDEFLVHEESFGKMIVHGHTPVIEPDIRANRINIDTGAYATGRLTCLVLEGCEVLFI
jgi:serine/threonine protein phosphatase 1